MLFAKEKEDIDVENKHTDTKRGNQGVGCIGRLGLTNIHY